MKSKSPAENSVRVCVLYYGAAWLCPLDRQAVHSVLQVMLAQAVASNVPNPPVTIELLLVDDANISKANRQYMHCTGPTNVLSFPYGEHCVGTLLLSLDTFRRECLLYGQDSCEHILRLLAHGIGHLCGLDHGPEMDTLCSQLLQAAKKSLPLS